MTNQSVSVFILDLDAHRLRWRNSKCPNMADNFPLERFLLIGVLVSVCLSGDVVFSSDFTQPVINSSLFQALSPFAATPVVNLIGSFETACAQFSFESIDIFWTQDADIVQY